MPLLKNGDDWLKNLMNGKKRKAQVEASTPVPKDRPKKKSKKVKPPVPKDRPKKATPGGARPEGKATGMPAAKSSTKPSGPKNRNSKGKPAYTKGGNAGDKTSKAENMSALGIQLGVKRKPKAKLHG